MFGGKIFFFGQNAGEIVVISNNGASRQLKEFELHFQFAKISRFCFTSTVGSPRALHLSTYKIDMLQLKETKCELQI